MKNTNKVSISIVMILALLLSGCGKDAGKEQPAEEHHQEEDNTVEFTQEQYTTAGIELGTIESKQISGTIKVNGQLDIPPQQKVSVSVPLGGFLKSTTLLQGTRVKKGQVIATIENLDFVQLQQDFLEAEGQLEFADNDYKRQQELAKENVAAQKVLQQAKSTYTSWRSKVAGLSEKLRVLNINIENLRQGKVTSLVNLFSPIDGYVTEVNVNIGKFVNPSDVLFEIVDTEHLHAELIVFEKDVPKLRIGQKVRFTLANETKERTATIYLLGREISPQRTIQIHCHIDQEDNNLLPGMYLKAVVETGGLKVPALPERAIIDYQGKKYIFYQLSSGQHEKLKDESKDEHAGEHHFVMLEIQIGNSEMGYTEVILPENSPADSLRVVIRNAYAILSKIKNSESEEDGH